MTDRRKEQAGQDRAQDGLTRIDLLRRGLGLGVGLYAGGTVLAACGDSGSESQVTASSATSSIDDLVAAAKKEGRLNLIALPPDWVNYEEVIDTFKEKYSLRVTVASPNATGAQENQAIATLKSNSRAPDCVDLGLPKALEGAKRGLYAEYKNMHWDTVPARLKHPDGVWTGDYWGVLSIGTNRQVVHNPPRSIRDLLDPAYKGKIALYGDPVSTGPAFAAVFAAALANGGSLDDIGPGIDFFAKLKENGNYIPVQASPGTIASGQTPITLDFDYQQLAYRDEVANQVDWVVNVPSDAVYANFTCQAISRYAPNPSAARLWHEFLYTDEGQLLWLKGYAHPARFDDLTKRNAIPKDVLDRLPPADAYKSAQFPTVEQTDKATTVVAEKWPKAMA